MSEDEIPAPKLRHRLEAACARGFFWVLSRMSTEHASAFGGSLVRAVGPLTRAHRVAASNLARAMPELTSDAYAAALSAMWDNFGRTMAEYALLARLSGAEQDRVTVSGADALAALPPGKPALLFCAHLANWEIIPLALATHARPLTIVYRAANNPLVDKIISDVRAAYTAGMVAKGQAGARQILKAMEAGAHLFMVVDQKLNTGLEIPFFGRGAFTAPALIRLAMRSGAPVFPVRTERTSGCRFHVTVEPPWTFADGDEQAVRDGLVRVNRKLEDWIRARPGQWLWMHRRWPAESQS